MSATTVLIAATTKPANAPVPAPRKTRLDSRARMTARSDRGTSRLGMRRQNGSARGTVVFIKCRLAESCPLLGHNARDVHPSVAESAISGVVRHHDRSERSLSSAIGSRRVSSKIAAVRRPP